MTEAEALELERELRNVTCPHCFRKHRSPVDAAGHCSEAHAARAAPPPSVQEELDKAAAKREQAIKTRKRARPRGPKL